MSDVVELRFRATESRRDVSAALRRPPDSEWLFVLAHGAGAGMRHRFLEDVSEVLARRRIATFRYQFPYTEAGGRRPDPPKVLEATVRSAIRAAAEAAPDLPILAGGKSMGGRMTSRALAAEMVPGVQGVVFLGFPLHPPGKKGTERADHLNDLPLPALFLQGTRDTLADLELLRPVVEASSPRATLHVVEGADHSFHVLKRSGRTDAEVLEELGDTIAAWAASKAAVTG